MLMNTSVSLGTVDLFAPLHAQRNSKSTIVTKSSVSPVTKTKLPFLQKIGIPIHKATVKKPSRWARAKTAIYNSPSLLAKTLSLFQRTPSSPAISEKDSYSALINNPSAPLHSSLKPLLPPDPTEPQNTSRLSARAETVVPSHSNAEYCDWDIEKKVDKLTKKTDEEKLSAEPGLRERRIVTSNQDELSEEENRDIGLPTHGKGNTASGMENDGNEDEAYACISFSPTPVVRYYASSRSVGLGFIAVNNNTSGSRRNNTITEGLIQQQSPVAFAISDRSSTPNAQIADSVRFSAFADSPHTAAHLSSSVYIRPNAETVAGHIYITSELPEIKRPSSPVENKSVGLQEEREFESISAATQPGTPSKDVKPAGSNTNSRLQPVNMESPIKLSNIAGVMVLGDLHDLQKGNHALAMLIQLPSFGSGRSTMRFDRWIKLFDNIVAMSDWTSEETVSMLITKLTGEAHEMLQNILDTVTKDYKEIKKLLHERFHGNENQNFFQAQLEDIKRLPGENIFVYGFRLKNIFERGYPKNAQHPKAEETTRFQILRQKFLAGLDLQTKYKVRFKHFKVYEDLVRETDKYDRRLEAEKEEIRKRDSVNAVTAPLSQSDFRLLWQAIEIQNEKINAITSESRINTQPPDKAIELIPIEDLTHLIMKILHHLTGYQQPPFIAPYLHPTSHQNYNAKTKGGNNFFCQSPSSNPSIQHQFVHPRTQPFPTPPIKCYFCGNPGHRQRECREQARVATRMLNSQGEGGRLMTYNNYGAGDHRSSSCPNKEPITCGLTQGHRVRIV